MRAGGVYTTLGNAAEESQKQGVSGHARSGTSAPSELLPLAKSSNVDASCGLVRGRGRAAAFYPTL